MRIQRPWSLEKIVVYFSLIASALTIGFVIISAYKSQWELDRTSVLISLSVVIVILAAVDMYLVRRYDALDRESSKNYHVLALNFSKSASNIAELKGKVEDELNTKVKIVQIIHNYSHEYRNVVNSIYNDLTSQDISNFEHRRNSFRMFIIGMLTNIKEIFDILTFDEVSVCIKLLDKDEDKDEFLVKTFMRDSISYRVRSETENFLPEYPVHENTAFKNIMDPYSPDSYYMCNDLENEKGYINANKNWRKSYNACLVVPIRILEKAKTYSVLGFICVDNFKGNFDDKIAMS